MRRTKITEIKRFFPQELNRRKKQTEGLNKQANEKKPSLGEDEKESSPGLSTVFSRTKAGREGERELVSRRREWDMSQAYSSNAHLPHPCFIVLFIQCTHKIKWWETEIIFSGR